MIRGRIYKYILLLLAAIITNKCMNTLYDRSYKDTILQLYNYSNKYTLLFVSIIIIIIVIIIIVIIIIIIIIIIIL